MKFKSGIQTVMVVGCWGSLAAAAACFFFRDIPAVYSLGVTALTVFTHFMIRFITAMIAALLPKKCFDCRHRWFQPKKWEKPLYKALGIKRLKGRVPTYDPDKFDFAERTAEELMFNSCQAEVIHELIAVLSFLPMLYSFKFGSFAVFLITSVLAAGVDLVFVVVQRYNRPRMLRLLNRHH